MTDRVFTIGQVANLFFDRSPQWLRWMERQGRIAGEAGEVVGSRKPNAKLGGGDRVYTLKDVATIADTLKRHGYLDAENRTKVARRIEALGDEVHTGKRQ